VDHQSVRPSVALIRHAATRDEPPPSTTTTTIRGCCAWQIVLFTDITASAGDTDAAKYSNRRNVGVTDRTRRQEVY